MYVNGGGRCRPALAEARGSTQSPGPRPVRSPVMTQPDSSRNEENGDDLARVTQEIAGRLRARGVSVSERDSSDDLVRVLEAVEAFERAVESRGGDLMMDEPPANSS